MNPSRVALCLFLASFFLNPVSSAVAQDEPWRGVYSSVHVGYAFDFKKDEADIAGLGLFFEDNLEAEFGPSIGVAVGYNFGNSFRVEGELNYANAALAGTDLGAISAGAGTVGTTTLFANAYYDFRPGKTLQPYIGAGLGFARASYNGTNISIDDAMVDIKQATTGAAAQIMVGLSGRVGESAVVYGEYRFVSKLADSNLRISADNDISVRYDSNRILFGLRYEFR